MKINGYNGNSPLEPAAAEGRSTTRAPEATAPVETVKLSGLSRSLQAGSAEPAFDAAKVEAIKAAIADGSFKVDTAKVADKLIASVGELLARRSN